MKKDDPLPKEKAEATEQNVTKKDKNEKSKKKKHNYWPLKAMIITFCLSFAINAGSEVVLTDAQAWLAILLTCIILAIGVLFDMVGTAATSCDIEPLHAMASRKVKGAKTAVKLAKSSDVVSSVCNDIVGDICGIVSGVCAASIASNLIQPSNFWLSVLIYAVISTATITLKAAGKGFAVSNATNIVFSVSKILSIFVKEG